MVLIEREYFSLCLFFFFVPSGKQVEVKAESMDKVQTTKEKTILIAYV